ncbi:MAG: PASTA domain-containing protein [Clostridia bacterium]|nr:PASTA domain-containing protein [Clostridia bacterium]
MLNTDRLCLGCMNDNGGERICAICGYDANTQNGQDQLPTKSWLNDRYFVGRALSSNAEGVTYIAWDNGENSIVTLREYFPTGIATRNPDRTVSAATEEMKFPYNDGLMKFMALQNQLMTLDLSCLIPTVAVFEENGTAYAVLQHFSGITLQDFLMRNGGALQWEQARPLFLPLLDTVQGLHKHGILHGGICPENIMVGRDGKLRLSGICIDSTRDLAKNPEAQIYPGFAAIEQYGSGEYDIGSATDVYALSAVLFRVLIGAVPPDAKERLSRDSLSVPAHFAEELPRTVLVAIAGGLQVLPESRIATVAMLRQQFIGEDASGKDAKRAPAAVPTKKGAAKQSPSQPKKDPEKGTGAKTAMLAALITAAVFLVIAGIMAVTVFRQDLFGKKEDSLNDPDDYASAPQVDQIGQVDSDAVESAVLFSVPDFKGKYYAEVIEDEDNERFSFSIAGKAYSNECPRGTVCAQSVAAGSAVEKDTAIALTISLGPQEFKIANVVGMEENEAKLELLKQGFLFENIEVVDMYDSEKKPGVVLEQKPEYGAKVSTEAVVRICINSFKGEEQE